MTHRTFYSPEDSPNAITTCNACGVRQMLPSEEVPSARGYCQECIDDAEGRMLLYTTAPPEYDYGYGVEVDSDIKGLRCLEFPPEHADKVESQIGRNLSGLFIATTDREMAEYLAEHFARKQKVTP